VILGGRRTKPAEIGATPESVRVVTRMETHVNNAPLSKLELDELGRLLSQVTNPRALSLAGMDGLFCALITGPACVTPNEYLPLLWGGPLADEIVTFNVARVNATILLLTRHWNSILNRLDRGAVHEPIVSSSHRGCPATVWANGFMRGVNFVQIGWNELLQDESSSELRRISQIAREKDPPVGKASLSQETSGDRLSWLGPALLEAYRYFRDRRFADRLMMDLQADLASGWHNSAD
jgi:uncharacterized protein